MYWLKYGLTDGKSTLFQVVPCHQTQIHYLDQCWPRLKSSCGSTSLHWVNYRRPGQMAQTNTASMILMKVCTRKFSGKWNHFLHIEIYITQIIYIYAYIPPPKIFLFNKSMLIYFHTFNTSLYGGAWDTPSVHSGQTQGHLRCLDNKDKHMIISCGEDLSDGFISWK